MNCNLLYPFFFIKSIYLWTHYVLKIIVLSHICSSRYFSSLLIYFSPDYLVVFFLNLSLSAIKSFDLFVCLIFFFHYFGESLLI